MTGMPLHRIQLRDAFAFCRPYLLEQHPWLNGEEAQAMARELRQIFEEKGFLAATVFIEEMIEIISNRYGKTIEIEKIRGEINVPDPVTLWQNKGVETIVVTVPEKNQEGGSQNG